MRRTDRRHIVLDKRVWWQRPTEAAVFVANTVGNAPNFCDHTNKPVASDFSRECITATGLHGKSDEVIVVIVATSATTKPGNADGAKDLWLVLVNVK